MARIRRDAETTIWQTLLSDKKVDDWDLSAFKFWAAGEEGNYLLKEFRSARHAEALKLINFAVHLLTMIR